MPKYTTPIDYTIYEKEVSAMYNSATSIEERVLISLCWITGARTSEILKITQEDVVYNDEYVNITIRTLKLGDRETGRFKLRYRHLKFTRPTAPRNIYLETIIKWSEKLTKPEARLVKRERRWVTRRLNVIGERVLNKPVTPYHFRHSVCTQLAMNGASIPEIMYFKGAISLNGVTPYIHAKPMMFKLESFNRDKGLILGNENGGNLIKVSKEELQAYLNERNNENEDKKEV